MGAGWNFNPLALNRAYTFALNNGHGPDPPYRLPVSAYNKSINILKTYHSVLVDRMVRAGIVQREANPDNRREVLLTVNPEFEAHVGHVRSEMIRWFEALTSKMGMDNFEKWHTAMVALNKVLNEEIHAGHKQKF